MPFGLTNAPATFQRLMECILAGLTMEECLTYIDDIIVFGASFEEHLGRLQWVLQRLREAGMKLKPSNCHFFAKRSKIPGTYHLCGRNPGKPCQAGSCHKLPHAQRRQRAPHLPGAIQLLQSLHPGLLQDCRACPPTDPKDSKRLSLEFPVPTSLRYIEVQAGEPSNSGLPTV